jgi:hypothetical protein
VLAPNVTPTGSLVYGHNKGSVVLFAYVMPNGRVYVSDELRAKQQPIEVMAKDITRKFEALGWANTTLACPEALAPDDDDDIPTAESPSQTFSRYGVQLWPVNIGNKDHGWTRTHEFLRHAPDGKPWLIVSPRCKQLIRTMPALVEDPNNVDDIDNGQEDRAALALRTLLASRPAPGSVRQSAAPPAYMTLGWIKAIDKRTERATGLLARR